MTTITSISQSELVQRRRQLRQQRRVKNLQSLWRTLTISTLAGSLAWVTTLPGWVIRQPEQIEIKGNQLLSTPSIRTLLPLVYPQSLLQLQPQAIADGLEARAPIVTATVTRQLLPPRLTVQVQERTPVAIATPRGLSNEAALLKNKAARAEVRLIDENGRWMPLSSYTALDNSLQLPTLHIIGMPEEYYSVWAKLYQGIRRSPVKISTLDWRNPANLILTTEIGIVHLGVYGPNLSNQLTVLDQMRQLPQNVKGQIVYIDLKNPQSPSIQLQKSKTNVKANTP